MASEGEDFDGEDDTPTPGFGALFRQNNGAPILFSMQDEEGIEQVSPLIKSNGGQLVFSIGGKHTIQLFVAGRRIPAPCKLQFKHTFIQDSVKAMKLQKLADYSTYGDPRYESMQLQEVLLGLRTWQELQFLPRKQLGGPPPSSPPSSSSWSSEDEEDRQRRAQRPAVHLNRKTRREFTHDNRLAIVHYILKHDLAGHVGGRLMWEDMAKANVVPGRTWQSLKEHYRRKINDMLEKMGLTAAQMKALAATGSGTIRTPAQLLPQRNGGSSQPVLSRHGELSQAHHTPAMKSSSNIPGLADNGVATKSSRRPSNPPCQAYVESRNAAGGGASGWLKPLPKKASSHASRQVVFASLVYKSLGKPSSNDRDESSSTQQQLQHHENSVTDTPRSRHSMRQSQESRTGLANLLPEHPGKYGEDSSSHSPPETDSEDIPFPSGSISSAKTRRSSPDNVFLNSFGVRGLHERRRGGVPYGIKVAPPPRGRNERNEEANNVGGSCIQGYEAPSCGNENPEKDVSQEGVRNSTPPEKASNDDDDLVLRLSDSSCLQSNASGEGSEKTESEDGVGYASYRTGNSLSSGPRQKVRDDSYRKSHHETFSDEVEDCSFSSPASVGDSTLSTESSANVCNAEPKATLCGKESVRLARDLEEHGIKELGRGIAESYGEPSDNSKKEKQGQLSDEAFSIITLSSTSKRSSPGGKEPADRRSCSASERSMRRESLSPAKLSPQKQNCISKSSPVRFNSGVEQHLFITLRNGKSCVSPARKNASVHETAPTHSNKSTVVCEVFASPSKRGAIHSPSIYSGARQDHHRENDKEVAIVTDTYRNSCPILETLNKSSDTHVQARLHPNVLLTAGISTSFKVIPPMTVTSEAGLSDHPGGSSIRVSPSKTLARLSPYSLKSPRETPSLAVRTSTLEVDEEDGAVPIAPTSDNIVTLSENVTSGAINVQVTSHNDVESSEVTPSSKRKGISIKETSTNATNLKLTVAENLTDTCRQAGEKPTTEQATDGNSGRQGKQTFKRGHSPSPTRRATRKARAGQSNKVVDNTDVSQSSDSSSDSSSFTSMAKQFRSHIDQEDFDNFTGLYDPTFQSGSANKVRANVLHIRDLHANHRKRPRGPQYSSDEDASLLKGIKKLNPNLLMLGGNEFWKKMEQLDEIRGRSWQSLRTRYHQVLRGKLRQFVMGPDVDLALIAQQLLDTPTESGGL